MSELSKLHGKRCMIPPCVNRAPLPRCTDRVSAERKMAESCHCERYDAIRIQQSKHAIDYPGYMLLTGKYTTVKRPGARLDNRFEVVAGNVLCLFK